MASDVVAYVAVSLDGYLAGEDGRVDFLERYPLEEFNFHGFFDGVGALVMGSTTYEQVLGWGWPYGNKPALVLTSRDLDVAEGATITFSSEPTGDAIRSYAATTSERLWVVGGGKVITDGLAAGAIDTLDLYVMPEILGGGIPLFTKAHEGALDLVESNSFANGVVRLVYRAST